MNSRYISRLILLLTALLVSGSATAQVLVKGSVYGGGNDGDVRGKVEVDITGGTVNQDVYGGGKGATTVVSGDVAVTIGAKEGSTLSGTGMIKQNVYGGSALGAVNATKDPSTGDLSHTEDKTTTVNIYKGTVTGSVFGGGLGHDDADAAQDIAAQNFGSTTVNMEGGTATAVYGGANENGVLKQDATVNITGGTIGTARVEDSDPVLDVVFGGGLGQPTLVEGDVTVKVGTYTAGTTDVSTPTIYGNAYGGSALGNVNASKTGSDPISYDDTKKVNVNLYSGTIYGNVFGGCLGRKADAEVEAIEAFVGGDVTVILDGAKLDCVYTEDTDSEDEYDDRVPLTGQIFGCNNWNGTPLGHVLVHVKRTVESAKLDATKRDKRTTYDVAAVYGGGNQADYVPRNALLDPAVEGNKTKFEAARAQVIIEGCDLTSIEYVYGGGNAASVPATEVIVRGTYIIDYLFGGGNGKSTSTFINPGADIGLRAKTTDGIAYASDPTKEAYGTGRAVSKLIAGKIHVVYGGSNTKGNVRQGTSVTMPQESGSKPTYCSEIDIREIYGAGQNADQDGGVDLVLGCVKDMDVVYGGAKDAHIAGGINLTITSGKFKQIFGGNNESGTIQGPITLNIEETACDPIEIVDLYLGGNKAAYSIYGYYKDTDDGNKIKPRTSAEDSHSRIGSTSTPYRDPILNVVSCTSIGNVYGGGLGEGAVMYGSPTLNINMIPGDHAAKIDRDGTPGPDDDAEALGAIGNVFGGGKEAAVHGNATININTEQKVTLKSKEDNPGTTDVIENEFTVTGAYITGNVYGGGQDAVLSGNTRVSICAKEVEVDDKMVWQIVPEGSAGVSIAGDVFGAGKGETTAVNNTTVVMGDGAVGKSVYGGGELGHVEQNTSISIMGGAIGNPAVEKGGATIGNVYGGGMGVSDPEHLDKGLIKGNTTINISGGNIYHNVYGGGAYGSVGTYTYDPSTRTNTRVGDTGTANITITGGTIGINGKDNGMVFGSSRGEVAKPDYGSPAIDKNNLLAWVYDTRVTIGTTSDATPGPHIMGSVYGSGENGHTFHNASVTIHSGTIGINSADVVTYYKNNDVESDVIYNGPAYDYPYRGNVYGGGCGTDQYDSDSDGVDDTYNPMSGWVGGTASVTIDGGTVVRDVYGGGSMGSVGGSTSVEIAGNAKIGASGSNGGYVYAATRGDGALDDAHQAYVAASSLTVSGGTINGDAYGGGQNGLVKGAVTVSLTGGEVKHDVYGGGALAKTNTVAISEGVYPATNVTLNGATIGGILYGGGLGDRAALGEGHADVEANVNGAVTLTVSSGKVSNVFGCNNINGSPQNTVTVNVSGGTITQNVYGGGNQAAYTFADSDHPQNLKVNISGGTMNNVYGGGLSADVAGGIDVNITGGTITNDVYGGGALANTNTANWDAVNGRWSNQTKHTYYAEMKHLVKDVSSVEGYYIREGAGTQESPYTYSAAHGTAVENIKYYKKIDNFLDVAANGTTHKTTVNLTGGTIGNAYGGGLGKFTAGGASTGEGAVAAMVYGDVSVTVDGTKFTKETERVDGKAIPITGRVFGCNNKNGTPKGRVDVWVKKTKRLDDGAHVKNQFEIQGVYGGGNMADYVPDTYDVDTEFGQGTHVLIEGCLMTSIEGVYGGGNASNVPFTDVVIEGSFQIGYVFGGGNGGDKINKGTGAGWEENPGANVSKYTNVLLKGGTIGEAFGGSDSKGTVGGSDLKTDPDGICEMVINNIYGASKEADHDGNVILDLSRCSGEVDKVFGGSYNANVRGSVTINITSGVYTSVYGGNDRQGTIGGNIMINIEEVDVCSPIIIQNLFGGGSRADYPGTGAMTYKGSPYPTDPKVNPDSYTSFTSGNISINIKAATRIDRVFGGCDNAKVTGNTTVNINMVKGSQANNSFTLPATYTGDPIPNIHEGNIDDAIGTIGTVYGGGNQGDVEGNITVNIGTLKDVAFEKTVGHLTPNASGKYDVLGAHITGDVFGGGNEGDVTGNAINATGNTTVNIGTADYSGTANFEGISIDKNASGKGGSVYGGGNLANVLGNTNVTVSGGGRDALTNGVYVFNGIFGGGYSGSVGTFTRSTDAADVNVYGHTSHTGCIGKPKTCTYGGKCTVVVSGGQIGPVDVAKFGMTRITDGKGDPVAEGWVWGGSRGLIEDPADKPDTHFKSYVNETDVTIRGTAFIQEGIIGGGEFGRVLGNTLVKIEGGQIGVGDQQYDPVTNKPLRYSDAQFIDPTTNTITSGDGGNALPECSHYPYGEDTDDDGVIDQYKCLPYDPYYDYYYDEINGIYKNNIPEGFKPASTAKPSDGKTWIGVVYGGGSGYFPYEKTGKTGYDWCRSAGWVEGNTELRISGGHILTNAYGGNEYTDVKGKATVKMTGGTIGVPRTLEQIAAHPVTCYLFGAGKGDERTHFNLHNNVGSVEVDVSGGIIYGSVFGGAEDGHVLGNTSVTVRKGADFTIGSTTYTNGPIIGTWGTSYVDGNIFGGGRGFSGRSLVSGVVSGNVDVNIQGGTILGSIYGGGRLASVGTYVVPTTSPKYGTFIPDGKDQVINGDDITKEVKHGYITINISGGTIGKAGATGDGAKYSGNIFGGAMGRLTLLDGSINPSWSSLGVSRTTTVNITGGTIYRNVYGGGEFGTVGNDSHVTVGGTWDTSTQKHSHEEGDAGTIYGSVFGGGYGSLDCENWETTSFYSVPYKYNPMQWAACVGNNTYVGVVGGAVKTNVYGGGELASVGVLDFQVDGSGNYVNIKKHDNVSNGFAISWPYELPYIQGGKTTVTITGGRIGTTGDTGHVYGGGMGVVSFEGITDVNEQRYVEAFCANVRETEVNINYATTPASDNGTTTSCIVGSVYGGGQDGHVEENAAVSITGGLIGQSVYGGGQGESTYKGYLRNQSTKEWKTETEDICSWTAGKVYGNTSVNMSGGHVLVHVYGGGNLASVGKGNYSSGTDDYFPTGYGETLNAGLWTATEGFNPNAAITMSNKPTTMADHFLSSGKATVTITGGTVGTLNGISGTVFGTSDVTPTGMVFGGCRGRAAQDVLLDPRHEYAPNFYLGYANNTEVTIGTRDAATGPTIYSQVFGGGRDGHVRGSTKVEINSGTIGQTYAETTEVSGSTQDYQFYHRGNVYGSGSGLGVWDGTHHGMSSGSVTRNTTVDIYGGTIYNNVYGGGALSSVGPPRIDLEKDYADADYSKCTVNIYGGTIGQTTVFEAKGDGGCVYGASRGNDFATGESIDNFATVLWTEVNINPHPTDRSKDVAIAGNVYGGAKGGIVWKDTEVNLTGGRIYHDAYGGGQGTRTSGANMDGIAADVGGNVTVELNKEVGDAEKGCIISKVFGCNDMNGTPKGHVKVHVHATQNPLTNDILTKVPSYHPNQRADEGYIDYLQRLYNEAKPKGTPLAGIDETPLTAAKAFLDSLASAGTTLESQLVEKDITNIINKANAVITAMEDIHVYDVEVVYGGGDLAPYMPTKSGEFCEVIIDGCQTTSIYQVYGGGNAASTPANSLRINEAFLINEAFGGGNGLDNFKVNGKWYENPGANVGYKNYYHYDTTSGSHGDGESNTLEHIYQAIIDEEATDMDEELAKKKRQDNYGYGPGTATTLILGGRIRTAYGGSNKKGNIRTMAISQYQVSEVCPLNVGTTYGAGKNADIDGEVSVILDCVKNMPRIFGGSTNANINSGVTLNITNGTFEQVFGGNDKSGSINGPITINIEEKGCKPIIINELYGGGYLAPYSVYGYKKDGSGNFVEEDAKDEDGTILKDEHGIVIKQRQPAKPGDTGARMTPHRDPQINVISATRIGNIYGGGYKALVIGSPHVNVNMTNGIILEEYAKKEDGYASARKDGEGNWILDIGSIGTIFGGGNQADIYGDTYVDIGTGKWLDSEGVIMTEDDAGTKYTYEEKTPGEWKWYDVNGDEVGSEPVPFRNAAVIDGMVFGGGRFGDVGDFTKTDGKPTDCADGTGTCHVTISNGEIGPDGMQMTAVGGPNDNGHVFGGGRGTADLFYDRSDMTDDEKQTAIAGLSVSALADKIKAVDNLAYVNNTEVTIDGTAFVKASVYGGGFDGHVLGDTHVIIDGDCQIGCGRETTERHPASVWAADYVPTDEVNLECASWPYTSPYAPHDKFAKFMEGSKTYYDAGHTKDAGGGYYAATDGHTFYGCVFAGGSGYYPYAPGKWLHKAGWVEGNTLLEIKGGHILTNVYGGNEMTNVGDGLTPGKGKCTIRMTGGTLGVPRTLAQIDAHPVTCYLFGAGKGDQIVAFNTETNVKEVDIAVTGGRIYGSVFGGGEDGHVLGDVKLTIGNDDGTGPKIGTWGTSYVDGNIFGGGRGFSGNALTAGNVGGSIDLKIKGGTMLGSIYGGGRLGSVGYGLYAPDDDDNYGKMRANANNDAGSATTYYTKDTGTGLNKNGRGNIDINISGGTIGNDYEFVLPNKSDDVAAGIEEGKEVSAWTSTGEGNDWQKWKNYKKIPKTEFNTSNGRVTHTKGGNVFAGGMGRRTDLAGGEISNWTQLGNAKSTTLTIGGNAKIKGNVYGGGEFGAVTSGETLEGGTTTIDIQGGEIGTQIKDGVGAVKYTFGSVFGGGYGTEDKIAGISLASQVDQLGALVTGNTTVSMSKGHVWASVLGGGELAAVGGDANVTISGGEIGKDEVYGTTEPYYDDGKPNPGYVKFGSSTMGNVYGGGMGKNTHTLLGVVKGNTTVNINPGVVAGEPKIYHNVYGGGALGSVGTFNFSDGVTPPMDNIPKGNPFRWESGGVATVNIKGGTIGISGRDNGLVNGSSRGDVAKPVLTLMGKDKNGNDNYIPKDPYDKMAWVAQSIVTIGADDTPGPHIKGSVYGGGENGHVFTHATVNVKSGTIGIVNEADPWFDYGDEAINEKAWVTRGNVYGAGCGTDMYDSNDDGVDDAHNTWAGCVIGNTDVNISGGWVAQCVYGGGSLGSVGRILDYKITEHHDDTKEFAISWPVGFTYEDLSIEDPVFKTNATGKTIVNITGGRIGTTGSDNGDVFGSTRGEAGADRYKMAQLANVKETYVNINYPESSTATPENYKSDMTQQCITGSVYGGSENGHVNGDTHVLMNNGLVGHSIYGGGKGKTKVPVKLVKIGAVKKDGTTGFNIEDFEEEDVYDAKSYSFTAGKVYGNTYVDMRGGYVLRNIYGGGNMASVGKGNYAGGPDDYFTLGYGELTGTKNLWTSEEEGDLAWHFLNTGKTNVTVTGGQVGYIASDPTKSIKDGLPYGNIFGGCRGEATPNINEIPPYFFNPTFYSGFVNESNVNIGGDYRCIKKCTDVNDDVHLVGSALHLDSLKNAFGVETPDVECWEAIAGDGPKIYGSVYGGGQDGHVRRDAHVTVNKGEIGILYDDANRKLVGTSSLPLTEELDSPQWLFRGNVFGSGSGIDKYEYDFNGNGSTYTDDNDNGEYDEGETVDEGSYDGETVKDIDYGISAGSVTRFSQVDIFGGTIFRNVYGGGSRASVGPPFMGIWALKRNDADASTKGRQSQCTVNIKGTVGVPFPKTEGDPDKYNEVYGGEVYGASRGDDTVGDTFSTCIWTQVNIKNGAVIRGNVFGGGDAGAVMKDTEVYIGDKKVP